MMIIIAIRNSCKQAQCCAVQSHGRRALPGGHNKHVIKLS
jgi:hypothetical protein